MRKLAVCNSPLEYNGGQLYKKPKNGTKSELEKVKSTICLDYFDVTLEVSEPSFATHLIFASPYVEEYEISDYNLFFSFKGAGSKRYKCIYDVYLHGEKIGVLLTQPRSTKILSSHWCQFKIENHKLYQSDWIDCFEKVIDGLDASIRSYTRVDIALDSTGFLDLFRSFNSGKIDRLGRAKYSPYFEKRDGKDRVLTGLDWGAKGGDKCMTIYRKSDRIENENKQYISNFWAKNNLDVGECVERMELKMKSKAVNQIPSFDYKKLDNPSYLASVMRTHMKKWFEFIEPGASNVTRAVRVPVIDWVSIGGVLLDKDSSSPSNEVWSAKITLKKLYHLSFDGFIDSKYANVIISDIVRLYSLDDWYHRRSSCWRMFLVRKSLSV